MTSDQATQIVSESLRGESIQELRASALWELRFSNDIWLCCHEITCRHEDDLRELLATHVPEMLSRIDAQDVPRAALLFSYMMRPVSAASVNANGELSLEFGPDQTLLVRSDTAIVDWQWCLGPTCTDPYSGDSLISCLATGCVE
jgi:hypothetical protein